MMQFQKIIAIGVLSVFSQLSTAQTPLPTVALFDYGSLDTLSELGLEDSIVGVAKQGLPNYLQQFNDARYKDVGGLKNPDLTAIQALEPSIIVISGRQANSKADLEALGRVKIVIIDNSDYWKGFSDNVTSLASSFNAKGASEAALLNLKHDIDTTKETIKGSPTVMVVTHNNGSFGLRNDPIVTQLLALPTPDLPSHVKSKKHGSRTFTPLTVSDIAEMKPTALFIVDRSAAIGQTEQALNIEKLKTDLASQGATSIKLNYLSPKLWYLSGNGLQSVRMQVKEIATAL